MRNLRTRRSVGLAAAQSYCQLRFGAAQKNRADIVRVCVCICVLEDNTQSCKLVKACKFAPFTPHKQKNDKLNY